MRRIQGEAKSHAASLSFKCDPGDHAQSSAGCACMRCRTGTARWAARLKTHACAHDAAESRARRRTKHVCRPVETTTKICALEVKASNAIKVQLKQLVFSTKDSSTAGVAEQMTPVHVPSGNPGCGLDEGVQRNF